MLPILCEGTCDENALHVEERMEEWVDELGSHDEELGQLVLHRCVDVIIFVTRNFEVLF